MTVNAVVVVAAVVIVVVMVSSGYWLWLFVAFDSCIAHGLGPKACPGPT